MQPSAHYLTLGLGYCIPSSYTEREIYSEFEVCFAKIKRLQTVSSTHMGDLKAWLNDLVHSYTGIPVSYSEFKWNRENFRILKSLEIINP